MDTFTTVVSFLLTIFVTTDLAAAYLLLRTSASADYQLIALNERAFVASVQAVSGSLLGILGANRIIPLHFGGDWVLVILSTAVLLQAVPAIIWLSLYFLHRFGNDKG